MGAQLRLDRVVFIAYATRRVIAICLIAGLLLAGVFTVLSPAAYTATSRALVSPNAEVLAETQEGGAVIAFAQQRAQTYAELVGSPTVVNPVARQLRIDVSDTRLEKMISAEVVPGTQLIEITATGTTPTQSATLANGVADQLAREVSRLEQQGSGATPTVVVNVVQRASLPAGPAKPLVRNLIFGLLAGLLVAVLAFLARLAFGQDLTDADAIVAVTGAPPIASVGARRGSRRSVLAVRDRPLSAEAEDYRRLATSLQYHDTEKPARSVVVAGVLGGTGTSTVTANLATALAENGRRVIVIDGDLHSPTLPAIFGVDPCPGFTEALAGRLDAEQLFQPCGRGQLAVLPPGELPANPGALTGSPETSELIQKLTLISDIVLIDSPALLEYSDGIALAAVTEGTVLVVRYGKVGRTQLQQAVDLIDQVRARLIGTVFHGVPRRGPGTVTPARRPTSAAPPADRPAGEGSPVVQT